MKALGFWILILSLSAYSETLTLKEFDQVKLGELLSRLPEAVAPKTSLPVPGEMSGSEDSIIFPSSPQGFQINCRRTFYNGSPYPSATACSVTMDPTQPSFDRSYDEIRFKLTDLAQVQALSVAIPYGTPMKEYYSWERDAGTNYEGKPSDVFHYRIECGVEHCLFRFSGKSTVL